MSLAADGMASSDAFSLGRSPDVKFTEQRTDATLVLHMAVPGLHLFLFVAIVQNVTSDRAVRSVAMVLDGMGTQLVTLQSGQVSSTHRLLRPPHVSTATAT
jgi:hypothetical protein